MGCLFGRSGLVINYPGDNRIYGAWPGPTFRARKSGIFGLSSPVERGTIRRPEKLGGGALVRKTRDCSIINGRVNPCLFPCSFFKVCRTRHMDRRCEPFAFRHFSEKFVLLREGSEVSLFAHEWRNNFFDSTISVVLLQIYFVQVCFANYKDHL